MSQDHMSEDRWTAVDRYITDLFLPSDPALDATLKESAAAGLPSIQVSPVLGKLLHLLAQIQGARKILEIGTLGGYSTIWLARALPAEGGRLVTLEANPKHAEVARANIARAGLSGAVELHLGEALKTLPQIATQAPFDLIFIDADKPGYPDYFPWALKLSRPGSLIIADNVVRQGGVADATNHDPSIQAVRRFNEILAHEPRVEAIVLQTVGSKGYDGLAVARVKAESTQNNA